MTPNATGATACVARRDGPVDPAFTAAVGAVCAAVLTLAVWLEPDRRGYGTHEQLCLPPCAFRAHFGIPCPSCGLTTSLALTARLRVVQAAYVHPLGAPLFAMVVWTILAAGATLARRQPLWPFGGDALGWPRLLWIAAAVAAAWLFKIWTALAPA